MGPTRRSWPCSNDRQSRSKLTVRARCRRTHGFRPKGIIQHVELERLAFGARGGLFSETSRCLKQQSNWIAYQQKGRNSCFECDGDPILRAVGTVCKNRDDSTCCGSCPTQTQDKECSGHRQNERRNSRKQEQSAKCRPELRSPWSCHSLQAGERCCALWKKQAQATHQHRNACARDV